MYSVIPKNERLVYAILKFDPILKFCIYTMIVFEQYVKDYVRKFESWQIPVSYVYRAKIRLGEV